MKHIEIGRLGVDIILDHFDDKLRWQDLLDIPQTLEMGEIELLKDCFDNFPEVIKYHPITKYVYDLKVGKIS